AVIGGADYGRAGDDHVRAGPDRGSYGLDILSAIRRDMRRDPELAATRAERRDLRQRLGQEGLAAEAGIDGHDEDDVDQMKDMVDPQDRRRRIDHHPRAAAKLAHPAQHAM